MTEEQRRELMYYELLLSHIAEEVNVKEVIVDPGIYADGKHVKAVYRYDTVKQEPIGLELQVDRVATDAPKTLLAIVRHGLEKDRASVQPSNN